MTDAHDLVVQSGLHQNDLNKAVSDARAQVDQEIGRLLDPASYAIVERMLSLEQSGEFTTVAFSYAPEFSSAGAPLTGQQSLALAEILHHVNVPVVGPIKDQWSAKIESIDSTGLSAADREVILEATAVLGPVQIETLKAHLAQNTRHVFEYIQERWPSGVSPFDH